MTGFPAARESARAQRPGESAARSAAGRGRSGLEHSVACSSFSGRMPLLGALRGGIIQCASGTWNTVFAISLRMPFAQSPSRPGPTHPTERPLHQRRRGAWMLTPSTPTLSTSTSMSQSGSSPQSSSSACRSVACPPLAFGGSRSHAAPLAGLARSGAAAHTVQSTTGPRARLCRCHRRRRRSRGPRGRGAGATRRTTPPEPPSRPFPWRAWWLHAGSSPLTWRIGVRACGSIARSSPGPHRSATGPCGWAAVACGVPAARRSDLGGAAGAPSGPWS